MMNDLNHSWKKMDNIVNKWKRMWVKVAYKYVIGKSKWKMVKTKNNECENKKQLVE